VADGSNFSRAPETVKEQAQWAAFVAQFRDDPLGWVLAVYPWGVKGTQLEHREVDPWQAIILDEIGQQLRAGIPLVRIACAAAHGIGKSAVLVWLIHWFESCYGRSMCKVTAGTLPQLMTTTWRELEKWRTLAMNHWQFEWTQTRYICKWKPNTWYAAAIAWSENNPAAFAGTHEDHVMMVFDEASTIATPIWETAEGAFTTKGIWLAFGNPTESEGRFFDLFGRFKHRWTTLQVDGRDSKNTANKKLYDEWIEDYGYDSDFVRVRVRGLFPIHGSVSFISPHAVAEAVKRWEGFDHRTIPASIPLLMGVDVARQGKDWTSIVFRKGRFVHKEIHRWQIPDTMVTASKVAELIRAYKPDVVFIDETGGYGAAVIDRLRQLNIACIAIQFGSRADEEKQFANKRAEMWARMKEWIFREGMIPPEEKLREGIITPGYGHEKKTERLLMESKDSIRSRGSASPDDADALAMTFAHRVPMKMLDDEVSLEPEVV
jgi:hypothetical protein